MSFFGGFGSMFSMMSVLFPIFFLVILGLIVATFVRSAKEHHKNNNSPRLTVEALVVSKRTDVTHHHHDVGDGAMHTHHTTWYYATFQVESGDRLEFSLQGPEYGMLMEGDRGKLTFQGTRYLGFERI